MKPILTLAITFFMLTACEKKESPRPLATPLPPPKAVADEPRISHPRDSYADVVERAAPAVVTVSAERRVRAPQQHPFFTTLDSMTFSADSFVESRQRRAYWRRSAPVLSCSRTEQF